MKTISAASHRRSRSPLALVTCATVLVAAVSAAPPAWGGDLPSAAQVIDAFVDATGGREAHQKIGSRVTHGSMSVVGMGIEGEATAFMAGGDSYFAWEAAAIGKVENGVHEGVAWEINPMSGARIKEGSERSAALRMAALDHHANWRRYYTEAECTGIEPVNERTCYKVVVTPKGENPMTHYYDTETALLVVSEVEMESAQGPVNVRIEIGDYREVDGVLVPFEAKHTYNDGLQTMLFKTVSVEHNADIPESRFEIPEVIRAKLEERHSEKTQ